MIREFDMATIENTKNAFAELRKEKIKRSILIIAVISIAIIALASAYTLNGNSFDFGNTSGKIVVTDSMDGKPLPYDIETIPVNSLAIIKDCENDADFYSNLKVGDVLAFKLGNYQVVHRIVEITNEDGIYNITTKGDANTSVEHVSSNSGDIIGKVVGVSPEIGNAISFMKNPFVILITMYVVLLSIMVPEVIKIVNYCKKTV